MIKMTKWYDERSSSSSSSSNRRKTKADTPIPISAEHTRTEKIGYYCNYCQCNLVKISDKEWYCNSCSISQYPSSEEVRSKSKISTPAGRNTESLVAYPPEHDDLSKKPVEVKGGLAELKRRGIHVTSYKEGFG
jgi:hypothetical protein